MKAILLAVLLMLPVRVMASPPDPPSIPIAVLLAHPEEYQLRIVTVEGMVTQVVQHELSSLMGPCPSAYRFTVEADGAALTVGVKGRYLTCKRVQLRDDDPAVAVGDHVAVVVQVYAPGKHLDRAKHAYAVESSVTTAIAVKITVLH